MPHEATESLCPVCLKRIRAKRVPDGEKVELVKVCPDHGEFRVTIWAGRPGMQAWRRPKTPTMLRPVQRQARHGCPFDCGLCPEHRQRSCTVLLEVTRRCNLQCPVCFADARAEDPRDPSLADIRLRFHRAMALAPGSNIQISGGEPTVRDDLPAVVAAGREAGFEFIQLNTNGIRLAEDHEYAPALKAAGLASVFLQFDGVDDAVYLKLRGKALTATKRRAIDACAACGIGVVLVPTLVPGVNTHQIGPLLRLAAGLSPAVRGVHFQPISYFGRYPQPIGNAARITLPELMATIEDQSAGMFSAADFRPPGCENAWCSFHADYLTLPGGNVRRLRPAESVSGGCAPIPAEEGARRAMAHVSRQWAAPHRAAACSAGPGPGDRDSALFSSGSGPMRLEDFLQRARSHTFTVSAMAFQDAWTLDVERLRDCCIHVLDPQYGLVPFCAYNVTALDGRGLYRR
jgi:uncharacterized radical SAM superfamily Fe-S cluster-containing enzyme